MKLHLPWLACATLSAIPVFADTVVFDLDYEFSGGTEPASAVLPWLRVELDDAYGDASEVKLTLTALNLTANERVTWWGLNFDRSAITPATFAVTSIDTAATPGFTTAEAPTDNTNGFKADGNGFFDLKFEFANSGAGRFTAGESIELELKALVGLLDVSAFVLTSRTGGGNGVHYSAAHVQAISGGGSGWIGADEYDEYVDSPIPEPSTYAAIAGGLAGVVAMLMRRRRTASAAPRGVKSLSE